MRSKKQQPNQNPAPIHRSIKTQRDRENPARPTGASGQAALTAAALHQLNRYADDIQAFLDHSRLDAILDSLQADIDFADPNFQSFLTSHRE
jgi:hypothetical protein